MSASDKPPDSSPAKPDPEVVPDSEPEQQRQSTDVAADKPARAADSAAAKAAADTQSKRPSGAKSDHIASGEADKKKAEDEKKKSANAMAIALGLIGAVIAGIVLAWYIKIARKSMSDKTKRAGV